MFYCTAWEQDVFSHSIISFTCLLRTNTRKTTNLNCMVALLSSTMLTNVMPQMPSLHLYFGRLQKGITYPFRSVHSQTQVNVLNIEEYLWQNTVSYVLDFWCMWYYLYGRYHLHVIKLDWDGAKDLDIISNYAHSFFFLSSTSSKCKFMWLIWHMESMFAECVPLHSFS